MVIQFSTAFYKDTNKTQFVQDLQDDFSQYIFTYVCFAGIYQRQLFSIIIKLTRTFVSFGYAIFLVSVFRNNYEVGASRLFIHQTLAHIVMVDDLNECKTNTIKQFNDCHENASCFNDLGHYDCFCRLEFVDQTFYEVYSGRLCAGETMTLNHHLTSSITIL